jgi:cysteine desulfurase
MTHKTVFLDANATMPPRPESVAAMISILSEPGNASSIHKTGRAARRQIEDARTAIAELIQTDPAYVFFTSGATEANTTILKSFPQDRILISSIEHPSVIESAPHARTIPVNTQGVIDLNAVENLLRTTPFDMVSVMLANNETGAIQPIADLVRLVRRISPATRVHCDAAQGAGKLPIDFSALQVDYMTLSAHKMGGPQGVGAMVLAPGAQINPLLCGGGQEKRQRPGTENVAAIAGFGVAARIAAQETGSFQKLATLRDSLEAALKSRDPRLVIFSAATPRLANTTQIALPGVAAETQLMALDLEGICVSSGSACSSGTVKPSHVLKAMGATDAQALGAIRISMAWNTTQADIDAFLAGWDKMYARIKDKVIAA